MIRVDLTGVEETAFSIVPPGNYEAVVAQVDEKEGPKGPYLEWQLKLVETLGMNSVWFRTSFSPQSLWNLKRSLRVLGMPHDGVVQFSPNDVVGRRCVAVIENEQYQGRTQARVVALELSQVPQEVPAGSTGQATNTLDADIPF